MQLRGAGGCGRASLRRRPRGPRPVRPRARCGRLLPPSSRVFVCGGVGGERESAPRCRVPAPSQGGWGPLRATRRRRRRLARTPVARAARTAPGAPPPPAAARTCPSRSPASKQRRPPAPRPRAPAPAPSLLPGRAPRPRHEERAMIPANASARKGPEGKYPLHYLVWYNRHRELEKEVRAGQVDIEQLDPRGRTPLHLATTLGHLECARVLLAHGADVGRENRSGWTVLQEAVSTRDLELVQLVLRYRDYQRVVKRLAGIPVLLEKLRKVYGASNVELITRTRTEHLSEQHKGKVKGCKTPLQSFLGIAEQHGGPQNGTLITQTLSQANPTAITAEEYFNPNFELGNRDMGRPMELTTKTQNVPHPLGSGGGRFKAKLWLCEEHPLSLCEQVAPIIDLMAVSNALFAKLRDFITLRLPPGFPVKIEIPIFHILNARITFGNLNGCDEPVPSVRGSPSSETPSPGSDSSSVSSSSSTTSCRGCEISPALFEAPRGYSVMGGQREAATRDDDDDLLQFAIQQSLLEAGSEYDQVTIWEALTNSKPGTHPMSYEGRRQDRSAPPTPQRQPAPPASVPSPRPSSGPGSSGHVFRSYDEQLRLAMELSAQEQEERRRRARQEEEELERILRLSLTEQ
ncbi:ankyrin repeat domain-containing protein 13B isoform X3 [Macaca fascicularis]|uniref:ankyrin repeat domain-containing protein 13B isoform X3 n=1 Tax=Macaca fascicularis TaxID=9541 RepID=UPI001E258565|nr:ankyrin repeat domain-containing protein 13B isoform X3 [Macaca fascicularis]